MPRTRQALTVIANGFAVVVIAAALFGVLANTGMISRPGSERFTFGG